jgi:hypothetical protein|tara:strand:+ start:544 stop:2166 length:1623 start_codon:yes stop_codon:yes gene_type:complete
LKSPKKHRFLLFGLIIAGAISCATPRAPTGGPSDKAGPKVEYTIPETGTTNFDGRSFTFQFNEFVNRSTVASAITVEPDLGIEYKLDWRRTQLTIEFEDSFPDSTTIILTLGTDLSDTKGNKLGSPIRLAISTGDEIDQGEVSGRIRLASNGRGAGDQKVLLYRSPFDFTQKASYEAQTDTGGVFEFSYLADGRYKALYVDDRNRNKIWDQGSESAYPFFKEFITLEKEGKDTLDVIYTSQIDSIAPNLQGVGLFSTNRMRLRFSENVRITENTELTILDSLGSQYSTAYPLYISPKEQFVAFAQSEEPLLENKDYTLRLSGITDASGNSVDTSGYAFTGSAQEDTTMQRHISANGANGILQDEVFEVTFAAPITDTDIIDSTVVIEGQVDFDDWPEMETNRNKLLIRPQGEWIAGVEYQFLVWNPVTQRRKLYEPQVWDSTEYGEIEVVLENVDSTDIHYLRVLSPDGEEQSFTKFNQTTTVSALPPLSYTLILFKDKNGDGKWNRGSVVPYKSPERYYVQEGLRVQEGFTSGVNINFD